MRSFAGATEWLNSEPLGPAEARRQIMPVLVIGGAESSGEGWGTAHA
jgi:hypothetical protein